MTVYGLGKKGYSGSSRPTRGSQLSDVELFVYRSLVFQRRLQTDKAVLQFAVVENRRALKSS